MTIRNAIESRGSKIFKMISETTIIIIIKLNIGVNINEYKARTIYRLISLGLLCLKLFWLLNILLEGQTGLPLIVAVHFIENANCVSMILLHYIERALLP